MAQLRLTPMVERAVEGTHRDVHREAKRAPCHSHAFVSLVGRFGDLAETVMSTAAPPAEYSDLLSQLHSPRDCVVALGLGGHPGSVMKSATAKDRLLPVHVNVVYRADPFSKYGLPAPLVTPLDVGTVPFAGHVLMCTYVVVTSNFPTSAQL